MHRLIRCCKSLQLGFDLLEDGMGIVEPIFAQHEYDVLAKAGEQSWAEEIAFENIIRVVVRVGINNHAETVAMIAKAAYRQGATKSGLANIVVDVVAAIFQPLS